MTNMYVVAAYYYPYFCTNNYNKSLKKIMT